MFSNSSNSSTPTPAPAPAPAPSPTQWITPDPNSMLLIGASSVIIALVLFLQCKTMNNHGCSPRKLPLIPVAYTTPFLCVIVAAISISKSFSPRQHNFASDVAVTALLVPLLLAQYLSDRPANDDNTLATDSAPQYTPI